MGGDHAPSVVVEGAVATVRAGRARVVLAGPEEMIRRELARYDAAELSLTVVDAPDVIGMHERPPVVLRRKPQSSVGVAARLVASGAAAEVFTAGHSGAPVLSAHAAYGMITGVERP